MVDLQWKISSPLAGINLGIIVEDDVRFKSFTNYDVEIFRALSQTVLIFHSQGQHYNFDTNEVRLYNLTANSSR